VDDHSRSEPRSLDPRIVRLWAIELLGRAIGLAVPGGALLWRIAAPAAGIAAAVAILVGAALIARWLPAARFHAWRLQLREHDLILRYGVLWRVVSVVPYHRIQHVDTRRGPLERGFGLSRLVVFTAGTRGAALVVPGLDQHEAETLRDRLASLGGGDDAV